MRCTNPPGSGTTINHSWVKDLQYDADEVFKKVDKALSLSK
jgi:hypothetical protein